MFEISALKEKKISELQEIATKLGIKKITTLKKMDLAYKIINRYKEPDFEFDGIIESEGVLDIMQEGYGFLRSSDYNYLTSPDDIYVSQSQVKLFGLKNWRYNTRSLLDHQKKVKNIFL